MILFLVYVNSYPEAVPKKIVEIMNEPGLTREHVASHLQVCFHLYY